MNKLFTSIAVASLSLTMAVGVGVAVKHSSKAEEVKAANGDSYELVTDASTLSSGDKIVIGSGKSGSIYLLSTTQNENNRTATGTFTVSNNKVTLTDAVQVLTLGVTNSHWTFSTGSGYLYAASSSKNYLRTQTTNNSNGEWTISISNGNATVTAQGSNTRNILKYNANNGSPIFSCYSTSGTVAIYKETGSSGASVESVSITGSMTKKSYTTVEAWDKGTMSATVTMSDSSTYGGTVSWGYDPTTPAAYVVSNEDEVTNGTVRVTATADSKSDYVDVTGISVAYATVAQGLAATPSSGNLAGVIVKGIISQITEVSVANGNATYFISDDGLTTSDQLEVYRGKGLNGANFTNVNDIRVGDIVAVYGSLTTYNSTKEFTQNNHLVSLDRPASDTPVISITETDFYISVGDSNVTLHETHENMPSGGSIVWSSGTTSVATIVPSTGVLSPVAKGHSTITVDMLNSSDVVVATHSITVTVLEPIVAAHDVIYLTAEYSSTTYYLIAMGGGDSSGTTEASKIELTVQAGYESGTYSLKNNGYFLAYSSSATGSLGSSSTKNAASSWIIGNDGTHDLFINAEQKTRQILWNYNNGSHRFGCYASHSETIINIGYGKVDVPPISGIVAEGQYRISATRNDVTYYLKENGTSSAPSAVKNFYEATIFTFTLVDTNTYEITHGANYLYSTASNNGVRIGNTADTWLISTGTLSSGAYDLKELNNNRFLTLYNAQDFRAYDTADATNRKENSDLQAFTAAQFASEFMSTYTNTCDPTGATPVDTSTLMWSTAASQFAALSTADQNTLRTAVGSSTGSDVEKTASRYDVIIAKYGSATINDFMGRGAASQGLAFNNLFAGMNSESTIAVIIVVALSSVTAIGAIFFIKRRKYN